MVLATLWAVLVATTGCTSWSEYVHNGFKVGPNYQRPPAPVAENWINANDVRLRKESDDLSHWWTVFNDPILNGLVADSYRQNITLRQAAFRVLQARAVLGVTVGGLFPQTFQAIGDHTNNAISTKTANRSFVQQRFFGQYDSGFNMSWELDFWGRLRRAIIAANDNLDASVENYDDVLVTMLGDVATNYAQIRILQAQIAYTRANVELQRSILTLVTARYKGGQVTALDVDQAQSILSQTESQIPALEITLRQANNALCVLLGISPEDLVARIGTGPIPTAPPEVAVGVPADLLRRRPDVRMAERLAAAQAEQIGIAEAEFYPHIYLNGTFEYSAQAYRNLFNQRAQQAMGGPTFQWNVLNFGRILNNVRAQDAEFQQLVAAYQFTVVTAAQETENGLITFLKSQEQTNELTEAVSAAQEAVNIAIVQYRGGLTDFNRVATLAQNLVQFQNLLAQAKGSIVLGLVNTYRALGGGWDYRLDPGAESAPGLNAALNRRGAPAAEPVSAPNPFVDPQETLPVPAPKEDKKAEEPAAAGTRPAPKRTLADFWSSLRPKPAEYMSTADLPTSTLATGNARSASAASAEIQSPAYIPTVGEAKILRPNAAGTTNPTPSMVSPGNWMDMRSPQNAGASSP